MRLSQKSVLVEKNYKLLLIFDEVTYVIIYMLIYILIYAKNESDSIMILNEINIRSSWSTQPTFTLLKYIIIKLVCYYLYIWFLVFTRNCRKLIKVISIREQDCRAKEMELILILAGAQYHHMKIRKYIFSFIKISNC